MRSGWDAAQAAADAAELRRQRPFQVRARSSFAPYAVKTLSWWPALGSAMRVARELADDGFTQVSVANERQRRSWPVAS